MEIIGRVTGDAKVRKLNDGREVVSFSIAINDYYKTKDGEKKNVATFIDCSYWVSNKIAEHLKKGSIVSLFGRIGINAYINMKGEAQASLTFHVNNIKVVVYGKKTDIDPTPTTAKDDLPF